MSFLEYLVSTETQVTCVLTVLAVIATAIAWRAIRGER